MNKTMIKIVLQLFVLIILLALITANALPVKDPRCPPNEGTNSRLVLLPHNNDCGKYYYCAKGYRVEMDCPSGLVFNTIIKVCDWPRNFQCNIPSNDGAEIHVTVWRDAQDH